jgi:hypothetical protein
VTLDVLAFDGRALQPAPMAVYWFPAPCIDPDNDGYNACYPAMQDGYPQGVDLSSRLATGSRFSFALPADMIANHRGARGDLPYGVAIVFVMACAGHVETVELPAGAGPEAMPFGCFDVDHQPLGPDQFSFAYATVFAFADRTNANPIIDHLIFQGAPVDPAAGISLAHCTSATLDSCPTTPLDLAVPDASQELDPGNVDPSGQILREQIWVDYLVSGGKLDNDVAILRDPRTGAIANTADALFPPLAAGDYRLWAVVRDNRGGTSWLDVPLHAN